MRKIEYIEKRETVLLETWSAAKTIAENLLKSGYKVRIRKVELKYNFKTAYGLDFINPDWDEVDYEVSGDYEEREKLDGSFVKEYKQSMSSMDWNETEKIAQALVDSDYDIYIWTDGETFGGTTPLNYTIHFVHKEDHTHEIRLVE